MEGNRWVQVSVFTLPRGKHHFFHREQCLWHEKYHLKVVRVKKEMNSLNLEMKRLTSEMAFLIKENKFWLKKIVLYLVVMTGCF